MLVWFRDSVTCAAGQCGWSPGLQVSSGLISGSTGPFRNTPGVYDRNPFYRLDLQSPAAAVSVMGSRDTTEARPVLLARCSTCGCTTVGAKLDDERAADRKMESAARNQNQYLVRTYNMYVQEVQVGFTRPAVCRSARCCPLTCLTERDGTTLEPASGWRRQRFHSKFLHRTRGAG